MCGILAAHSDSRSELLRRQISRFSSAAFATTTSSATCTPTANTIDRRTTVIILGDARSNYGDPRADLMRWINQRARQVVWLNPEPETFWGTGDSEMRRYRPYCHVARTCRTIKDLERVVDDILRSQTRT